MTAGTAGMERWFRPSFSPPAGGTTAPPAWPPPAVPDSVVDPRMFPQRLYYRIDDLGDFELRSAEVRLSKMLDLRLVNQQGLLVYFITTSLDQAVSVEAIGADVPEPSLTGVYEGVGLSDSVTVTRDNNPWSLAVPLFYNTFPWMGVRLRPVSPPGAGGIRIRAGYQRWTE